MLAIKNDYDYLIHLVRCTLHNEQPMEAPETVSFDTVLDCALKHEIGNVAYYSVERLYKKPSEDILQHWQLRRDFAIERECNQSFARDEIVNEFQRLGIRSLEVQGTKIKTLYPLPELRTMSDIDFIIDLDHLERAGEVLRNLGYTCKKLGEVEIDGFRPPNIHIELHTEYFPADSEYHNCMRPPFVSIEESGIYDVNDFYIYNMLHVAKHYFCRGCGIRRIMDVYYLNRHFARQIDREYVESVFQKSGVVDFVTNISLLAEYWFGKGCFFNCFKEMIPYITGNPLHGTEENQTGYFLQKEYGPNAKFIKLRYIVKMIFAGDDIMLRHYPILKKWRVMYPVCWLHRMLRAAFHPKKRGIIDEAKRITKANIREK